MIADFWELSLGEWESLGGWESLGDWESLGVEDWNMKKEGWISRIYYWERLGAEAWELRIEYCEFMIEKG